MGRTFWIFVVVLVVVVGGVGVGSYLLQDLETDAAKDRHWSQAAEACDLATSDDERDELAQAFAAYQRGTGEPFELGGAEFRVTSKDDRTMGVRDEAGTWLCTAQRIAG